MYKSIIPSIIIILLLVQAAYAQSNFVYSLTLKYDSQTLTNEGLKLIDGKAPTRIDQPEKGFLLEVVSFEGETLHSFKFLIELAPVRIPPRDIFDDKGNQIKIPDEPIEVPDTTINLVIPHFYNAKYIEIYSPENQKLLTVDVSKYSHVESVGLGGLIIPLLIIGVILVVVGILILLKFKRTKAK